MNKKMKLLLGGGLVVLAAAGCAESAQRVVRGRGESVRSIRSSKWRKRFNPLPRGVHWLCQAHEYHSRRVLVYVANERHILHLHGRNGITRPVRFRGLCGEQVIWQMVRHQLGHISSESFHLVLLHHLCEEPGAAADQ